MMKVGVKYFVVKNICEACCLICLTSHCNMSLTYYLTYLNLNLKHYFYQIGKDQIDGSTKAEIFDSHDFYLPKFYT